MYNSFSCDKNSLIGHENAFSGRNSNPPKNPVVITGTGDENQQNRIQLAVHKYNNSAISCSSRNLTSSKHNFLRNSLKTGNCEDEAESTLKSDGKSRNLYEGVGAFPTIHLKKNTTHYRPVKRSNEVKVPNPELPLSRFFNHLLEFSPDLKSNTRSVLDVLQDLSSKKINLNDQKECSKGMSKGLGGDLIVNGETLYRPLFIQKPKSHSVLTRDNTTQTLFTQETSSKSFNTSDSSKTVISEDPSDLRVQLRKKLAKQNNEIFASLSSSISLLPAKRKLDKVLCENSEISNGASEIKRVKINDNQVNGLDKNMSKFNKAGSGNHLTALKIKSKLNEINTTSPNKDRLTTIFLDMQNISPVTQIFQEKLTSLNSNPLNDKDSSSLHNFQCGMSKKKDEMKASDIKTTPENDVSTAPNANCTLPSFIFSKPETTSDYSKAVNGNSGVSSFYTSENSLIKRTMSQSENNISEKLTSDSTTIKNNLNSQNNNSLFNKNDSTLEINYQNSSDLTKKKSLCSSLDNNNESSTNKFKFGMGNNATTQQNNSFTVSDINNHQEKNQCAPIGPEAADNKNPVKLDIVPQFSFGVKKSDLVALNPKLLSTPVTSFTTSITSSATTTAAAAATATTTTTTTTTTFTTNTGNDSKNELANSSTSNTATCEKPGFSINQQGNNNEEKKGTNFTLSPASSIPNTRNTFFANFGDKPAFTFGKKIEEQKTNTNCVVNPHGQSVSVQSVASQPFTSQTNFIGHNSSFNSSENKSTGENVAFGEKPKLSDLPGTAVSSSANTITEEKKTQPLSPFSFEQTSQNSSTQKENEIESNKKPSDWFVFGQKALKPETTLSHAPPASILNQFNSPSNAPQNLPKLPPQPSLFGQSSSLTSIPQQTTLQTNIATQNQNSSTDSVNGSNLEPKQPATSLFLYKTPFGGSGLVQPSPTSSTSNGGFGTVYSTQPNNVFGVKSTIVETPVMTSSTSSQPNLGFGGNQTLNAFGTLPTTKSSGFGTEANAETSKTFGFKTPVSSTTGNSFITSTAQQSNKPFTFGSSSSPFGQPSEQNTNKISTTNIFNQTTSSQNLAENNTFGTSNFGTPTSQNMFVSKVESSPSVFGQNSKAEAFNQNTQSQNVESQNKFSFGTTTITPAGFPSTLPSSTATPIFNFGGGSGQPSSFTFGNNTSSSSNTQFAFKNPSSDGFKFGTPVSKDSSMFGNLSTPAFSFNNQPNSSSETKSSSQTFNFGNNQSMVNTPAFNFGSTSSSSVFNFGGSGSSTTTNSGFNFGAPQPSTPFGQTTMPSVQPFSGPGTFSIGSGSSQSRPKASSRLRRRP